MRPETGQAARRTLEDLAAKIDRGEGTEEMRRKMESYQAEVLQQARLLDIPTVSEVYVELQY
jgi:hypothetical protein